MQATTANVTTGTTLVPDGGFTCIAAGVPLTVAEDNRGLFVPCAEGKHYLDGQLEEGDDYIGFAVKPAP